MRIKTTVVTQQGRVLNPPGAILDVDAETAGRMFADGRAVPADSAVLPVASAGVPTRAPATGSAVATPSGSGASVPTDGPSGSIAELTGDPTGTADTAGGDGASEIAEEVAFVKDLTDVDAVAYVESHDRAEHLQEILAAESAAATPRTAVIAAITARLEALQ